MMWLDMSLRSTVMGTEKPGRLISVGKAGWKMATIFAELALWQADRTLERLSPSSTLLCGLWH